MKKVLCIVLAVVLCISVGSVAFAEESPVASWIEMGIRDRSKNCFGPKDVVKKILQPPMIAVVLGFVLVMCNIKLPDLLHSALSYTGNITSPLALIFVGMILQRTGLSCLKQMDKKMSLALVGRFVISPLAMLLMAACFGLADLPTQVSVSDTHL